MHIHDKEQKLLRYSTVYNYLDKQSIDLKKLKIIMIIPLVPFL